MNNFFDYFDAIYCINLKQYVDRKKRSIEEFEKYDLNSKVKWFDAIENVYGRAGCNLSHCGVIKQALEDGCNNVLIFEDDFEFLSYEEEYFVNQLNFLKNNDWSMFYLGGNVLLRKINRVHLTYVSKNIVKVNKHLFGAFAYVINKNIFKLILDIYEPILFNILKKQRRHKRVRKQLYHHIDQCFAKTIQRDYNCYTADPMLASHLPGYGCIIKREMVEYNNLKEKYENSLRSIRPSPVTIIKEAHLIKNFEEEINV